MNKKLIVLGLLCCLALLQGLISPNSVSAARYIVQPGDTLSGLARRFGVSLEAIVAANGIENPDLIVVGEALEIPAVPTDVPLPMEALMVADFDRCDNINNLGGQMGAAYVTPHNRLTETYIPIEGRGCVAKLEYQMREWSALWLKLPQVDLTNYREQDGMLTFDIRANEPIPDGVQIEIKRHCLDNAGCAELSVYYMTAITSEWQTRSLPISGFGPIGWAGPNATWNDIEELVFTFAYPNAGTNGTVYLDNIRFQR